MSLYLFTLIVDELIKSLYDFVPWCIFFAHDIILIDETSVKVICKLKMWRKAIKDEGFKMRRSKTKHMHCQFNLRKKLKQEIKLDGVSVPRTKQLKYLGSAFQNVGRLNDDLVHKIQVECMKW